MSRVKYELVVNDIKDIQFKMLDVGYDMPRWWRDGIGVFVNRVMATKTSFYSGFLSWIVVLIVIGIIEVWKHPFGGTEGIVGASFIVAIFMVTFYVEKNRSITARLKHFAQHNGFHRRLSLDQDDKKRCFIQLAIAKT